MIQVKTANNTKYNTTDLSLELKCYMEQIASTENLREQLINQIYIITNIQQAINNNSIIDEKTPVMIVQSIDSNTKACLVVDDSIGIFYIDSNEIDLSVDINGLGLSKDFISGCVNIENNVINDLVTILNIDNLINTNYYFI